MASPDQFADRSDAELLELALAGQENAFLLLYERLKGNIFRYAFYMTNSKSTAEEVTQEVFMALLREGRNYRPTRGDVAAFAFGMARNFIRRIERRERAYLPLSANEALEAPSPDLPSGLEALPGRIIRDELLDKLHTALTSLPDHYRQVVVLCDLCELPYAAAASQLRCAVGTVRSRLNRAHALLAQKLKPLKGPQPDIGAAGPEGCAV